MTSVPVSRRALLRACARLSAVSALAAFGALPVAAQAEEVLRVSAIPDEAPTELQRKFAPLGAQCSQLKPPYMPNAGAA